MHRRKGHRDDRKDHAAQRPFTAPMHHEAHTPGQNDQRDRPSAQPDQDRQRRGDGGAEPAHQVLRGFVRGDHPARIVGRIAAQDQRKGARRQDQDQTQKLAPAAFQHRLGALIQKRIALPCL